MNNALVSIIMSTYREPINYLTSSIESILNQTFKDFEFIIVNDNHDDANLDNFLKQVASKDSRVKLVKNSRNLGLAESLNRALHIANGDYIARMDADDISLPARLERQIEFLEENKEIYLCGTGVILIDEHDKEIAKVIHPNTNSQKEYLFGYATILHPTWVFRRTIIEKVSGYRKLKYAQDVDFLVRLILSGFCAGNIEEPLLKYRIYKKKDPIKDIYQIETSFYIRKLVINTKIFEEGVEMLINNKLKKPNYFLINLHKLATRLRNKAIELKLKNNKIFYFILIILSSFISPYQFLYLYGKVYFKIVMKFNKNVGQDNFKNYKKS
jgi:glycosyltransferase involved in cell wall biosynthesis